MLQYLFLLWGSKPKTKAAYTLKDLPRKTGGIIGRIIAWSQGRSIHRPTPQERLDLLNYCINNGLPNILHKKPYTERDQVAYKIIRGYPISTHKEWLIYGDVGGWKGKVRKWKNKPSTKTVVLTWPTKGYKIDEILKLRREHLIDNMLIICKDATIQAEVDIKIQALYKTVSKTDPNYTYVQTHKIWVCTSTEAEHIWRNNRLFEKLGQTIIVNANNNFFQPYNFERKFKGFSTFATV